MTVIPACTGKDCSSKPNDGWKVSKPQKQTVMQDKVQKKHKAPVRKRKLASLHIDLETFTPHRIEEDFQRWLADSKPAWSQLTFRLQMNRRLKKNRQEWKHSFLAGRCDKSWVILADSLFTQHHVVSLYTWDFLLCHFHSCIYLYSSVRARELFARVWGDAKKEINCGCP